MGPKVTGDGSPPTSVTVLASLNADPALSVLSSLNVDPALIVLA